MKTLVFLLLILFIFIFIFVKSNTWEIRTVEEVRGSNIYLVTKHSIHWERFFNYIKEMPGRFSYYFDKYLKKL